MYAKFRHFQKTLLFLLCFLLCSSSLQLISASKLYERQTTLNNSYDSIWGTFWCAQTFTVGNTGANVAHKINAVRLNISRGTTLTWNLIVGIRATSGGKPTGSDLVNVTIPVSTIPASYSWFWFNFTGVTLLQPSTLYAIVVQGTGGTSGQRINWQDRSSGNPYTGGQEIASSDSGVTWTNQTNQDRMFMEYGEGTAFVNMTQGWFTFNNIATWKNITQGYFTFNNIPSWKNITQGYFTFSNTATWKNITQGYFTFENTALATWKNLTQGWFTFQNTGLLNITINDIYPDDDEIVCPCPCGNFIFSVNVTQIYGKTMNITWYWNNYTIGSYKNITDGIWQLESIIGIEYNHHYTYKINVTDGVTSVERNINFNTDTYTNCMQSQILLDTNQLGMIITLFLFAFFMWIGYTTEKRSAGAFILIAGLILMASASFMFTYLPPITILLILTAVFLCLIGINKWLIQPNQAKKTAKMKK